MNSFEQLTAWQYSQELAVKIYLITKSFPPEERFGLTSQIRRSAASISANIAEGFGRKTIKDKQHFYAIAYGSLLETKNFLYLSSRLGYIGDTSLTDILVHVTSCQKLINALSRSLEKHAA